MAVGKQPIGAPEQRRQGSVVSRPDMDIAIGGEHGRDLVGQRLVSQD
jgi:hypothetical protein